MTGKKKDYITSVGRRKSAIARLRMNDKAGDSMKIIVNGRDYKQYFNYFQWQEFVTAPLTLTGHDKIDLSILVNGGGIKSQAEAVQLGIARLLVETEPELRPTLRKNNLLTRDPRVKERKKPGLKKARRAPQWSKR